MSNLVSAIVQKRKVGSLTRKGILMFMATCASDDGSGVWTSKANMARDLEMGKRTVQVGIDHLVKQGLISEVGTRRCAHGYTVEYCLNLDAIRALEKTCPGCSKTPEATGAALAPVRDMQPTHAGDAPQEVQDVHLNHTGTIQEPLCLADAQSKHAAFDEFWKVYPRPKDRNVTERAFNAAVAKGVEPDVIIAGARAYAAEQSGNRRQYIKLSANWLNSEGWFDYTNAGPSPCDGELTDKIKAKFAVAIATGNASLARHCPAQIALELIAANTVTPVQCRAVGLSVWVVSTDVVDFHIALAV